MVLGVETVSSVVTKFRFNTWLAAASHVGAAHAGHHSPGDY